MGIDGRRPVELTPENFILNATEFAKTSMPITFGKTRALCTVTIEDGVPRQMQDSGLTHDWITNKNLMLAQRVALEEDYAGIR